MSPENETPKIPLTLKRYRTSNGHNDHMGGLEPRYSHPVRPARINPIHTQEISFAGADDLARHYLDKAAQPKRTPRTADEWYAHIINQIDTNAVNNGFHPPSRFQGKTIHSLTELYNPDHPKGRAMLEEYHRAMGTSPSPPIGRTSNLPAVQVQEPVPYANLIDPRQPGLEPVDTLEAELKNWPRHPSAQPSTAPLPPSQKTLTTRISTTNIAEAARQQALIQEAFYDPKHPNEGILDQAKAGDRLPEVKMRQVELNTHRMLLQGQITQDEYEQLSVAAKVVFAQNWLKHDGKLNEDGSVTYRGVIMSAEVASGSAYLDAERYWDKEIHLSAQELGQALAGITKGQPEMLLGNDRLVLNKPNIGLLIGTLVLAGLLTAEAIGTIPLSLLVLIAIASGIIIWNASHAHKSYYTEEKDWIDEYMERNGIGPKRRTILGRNANNPNDPRCKFILKRDMDECKKEFPYNGSLYNRINYRICEGTAWTRYGECLHTGNPISELFLNKD